MVQANSVAELFCSAGVQDIITKYKKGAPDPLRLAMELRDRYTQEERHWIGEWITLFPKIQEKFGIATPLLCDRLALEQSTAKDLSVWKTRLWPTGAKLLDLCCGMGGDSFFLPASLEVTGVDRDAMRLAMFRENTLRTGTSRAAICADALDPPLRADFFQMDPARRASQGDNQRHVEDISPSWGEILKILPQYSGALLKLAPGFPLSLIPAQASITYLGSHVDCRECLVSFGSLGAKTPEIRAVSLDDQVEFSAPREDVREDIIPTGPLGRYLFEPSPVMVRSHLFPLLAKQYGLWQIDPRIAYLTGDTLPDSPWLTAYTVLGQCPLGQERVRQMLKNAGIKPITLKKRGVEVEPAQELKSLRVKTGTPGILFYTRIQDQKTAILTMLPKNRTISKAHV